MKKNTHPQPKKNNKPYAPAVLGRALREMFQEDSLSITRPWTPRLLQRCSPTCPRRRRLRGPESDEPGRDNMIGTHGEKWDEIPRRSLVF